MNNQQRNYFTHLRYDYYLGARCLLFHSHLASCFYLFGHVIELCLKHIMAENNITQGQRSHNIEDLFCHLSGQGLLDDIEVSQDFIKYVSHCVMSRYPSQIKAESQKASSRGETLGSDSSMIAYFDDLILQFDDILLKQTRDPTTSLGNKASTLLGEYLYSGKNFFHGNVAALSRKEQYLQFVRSVKEEELERLNKSTWTEPETREMNVRVKTEHYDKCLQLLQNFPDMLWDNKTFPMYVRGDFSSFEERLFAKEFVFPGKLNESAEKERTGVDAVYTSNDGIQMILR